MRTVTPQALPGTTWDPLYPDSDGRFMGDTDHHSLAMVLTRQGLEDFFADVPDVYVGMNIILYYAQGEPRKHRDPDILVARGIRGKHMRRSFRVWEECVFPRVLMEMVSESTVQVDLEVKRQLYEELKIPECFLFDPEGIYIDPVLQGFRLVRGKYEALIPAEDGSLISEELGLRLLPEGTHLRLVDLRTGKPVLTRSEQAAEARKQARAERRKAQEARRREADARQHVEKEKQRTLATSRDLEEVKRQADQEVERAAALTAEVQRLRELLGKQSQDSGGLK